MKFEGYAVKLCADGNVQITMVEKERSVDSEMTVPDTALADAIDANKRTLIRRLADNLPIKGLYEMVYDFFGDLEGKRENVLAEKLISYVEAHIYGDVLLLPAEEQKDGNFILLSMPLEVAETVALVCGACRYAIDNGCEDKILGMLV